MHKTTYGMGRDTRLRSFGATDGQAGGTALQKNEHLHAGVLAEALSPQRWNNHALATSVPPITIRMEPIRSWGTFTCFHSAKIQSASVTATSEFML